MKNAVSSQSRSRFHSIFKKIGRFHSHFENGFSWRLFLDLNQCYFSQRYRVFVRCRFPQPTKQRAISKHTLSIIRNGFTCRCVSVLQMCFKVVPRERFELNYPPVMSRSLLPIKLPRQFTVSPICHVSYVTLTCIVCFMPPCQPPYWERITISLTTSHRLV